MSVIFRQLSTTTTTTTTTTTSDIHTIATQSATTDEHYRWVTYVPFPVLGLLLCLVGCRLLHDCRTRHRWRLRGNRHQRLDDHRRDEETTTATTTTASVLVDDNGLFSTGVETNRRTMLTFDPPVPPYQQEPTAWHQGVHTSGTSNHIRLPPSYVEATGNIITILTTTSHSCLPSYDSVVSKNDHHPQRPRQLMQPQQEQQQPQQQQPDNRSQCPQPTNAGAAPGQCTATPE